MKSSRSLLYSAGYTDQDTKHLCFTQGVRWLRIRFAGLMLIPKFILQGHCFMLRYLHSQSDLIMRHEECSLVAGVSHKPSQAWSLEVYLPKPKLFLLAHTISSLARATRLVYQASPDNLLPNHRITPGFPFQTSYTMTGEKANKERYGFIIYRCDYSDDAQWERFMAYLKNQTRRGMESENNLELYDRMDWKVIVKSLRITHTTHCYMC
jgi:hypothetical protein